jgi:hypothetical protein
MTAIIRLPSSLSTPIADADEVYVRRASGVHHPADELFSAPP